MPFPLLQNASDRASLIAKRHLNTRVDPNQTHSEVPDLGLHWLSK